MGIFDALIGNANAIDAGKVAGKLEGILLPGEELSLAYKLVRDFFVFTEKRMLIVDVQGITGKKVEYLSIPYRSITRYSLETAGTFDMDAELKIWISADNNPIQRTLKHGTNVKAIQLALSAGVLR
ncbi:PH domain-containing protein [Devosia sp. 919]|uniref:PH domain-containing protein n=1 Tax=Devosia sp. 919 TaxID=2726065 RepID=UPI001552DD85|nr:PH domain-containing protein [Devosia sp. 919]